MQLNLRAVKCMHACFYLVVPAFMLVLLQITLVTMTYMHITLAKLCTCSQVRVFAMTKSLPVSSCVSLKPLILSP